MFSYVVSVNKVSGSYILQDGVWRITYMTRNGVKTFKVQRAQEPTTEEIKNLVLLQECGLQNIFSDVLSVNKISGSLDRPQDNLWKVKVRTPYGEKTIQVRQTE